MPGYEPKTHVLAALDVMRERPSLLGWQVAAGVVTAFARGAVMLGIALIAGAIVTVGLKNGVGVSETLSLLAEPRFVFATLGVGFCAWLFGFAVESVVWAGTWASAGRLIRQEETRFWSDAIKEFPSAIWQRIVVFTHDLAGLALLGTVILSTSTVTRWAQLGLWASAAVWGLTLTLYVVFVLLIRFTASVTAAGMFIEGRTWASAWLSAAQQVVRDPLGYYRMFLLSASALIPAMFVYYIAIFMFNLTVGTPLALFGEVVQLGGELVMMVGFTSFILLTQLSFFNAYAVGTGAGELPRRTRDTDDEKTAPSLDELLPRTAPYKVIVDELPGVRASETDHDLASHSAPQSASHSAPQDGMAERASTQATAKVERAGDPSEDKDSGSPVLAEPDFDLSKILRPSDKNDDPDD